LALSKGGGNAGKEQVTEEGNSPFGLPEEGTQKGKDEHSPHPIVVEAEKGSETELKHQPSNVQIKQIKDASRHPSARGNI